MSQESPNKEAISEDIEEWIWKAIADEDKTGKPPTPSFIVNGVYNAELHKLECEELERMYPFRQVVIIGRTGDEA